MATWHSVLVMSLALACCPWTRLQAQAPGAAPQVISQAQSQHRAAVRAFARGDYPQAIALFQAADQLTPSAAFSFNIAMGYEALGDNAHALAAYADYLRRSGAAPDAAQVRAHMRALASKAPNTRGQRLSLSTSPVGAHAFLDREPIGVSPVILQVRPGKHHVTLTLDGYQPVTRELDVPADRPVALNVGLARVNVAAPSATKKSPGARLTHAVNVDATSQLTAPTETGPQRDSLLRSVGLISLGASVAAFGSALTFEIMRANTERSAKHETEQIRFAQRLDTMQSQQLLARVFAGAGGALAALGGVLLVAASNVSSERAPPQGLAVACQPTNCRATMSGVF
jgi:tetratricopeptide (TPR) repeat protein